MAGMADIQPQQQFSFMLDVIPTSQQPITPVLLDVILKCCLNIKASYFQYYLLGKGAPFTSPYRRFDPLLSTTTSDATTFQMSSVHLKHNIPATSALLYITSPLIK